MATSLFSIGLVFIATLVGAMGPIFLKKASAMKLSNFRSLIRNHNLFAGVFLYAAGTVLFILALRDGELSVLYPFVSLNYVWVSLLSMKYLDERMNWQKWMGISLIILGVSFIGLGS